MPKATLVVGCSAELKQAVNDAAYALNISTNEACRRALAVFAGYDLESERTSRVENRGRPRIYKDDAERRKAASDRAKATRKMGKELVAQYRQQAARADMQRFRESVEAKYGKIDTDPTPPTSTTTTVHRTDKKGDSTIERTTYKRDRK